MTADDIVTRAAEVLIAHTRTSIEACYCGWGRDGTELGKSHAEHVAQALAGAGLLATKAGEHERPPCRWCGEEGGDHDFPCC